VRTIKARFESLLKQISNYDRQSEITRFNNSKTGELVKVGEHLAGLIGKGLEGHRRTKGYYDFTLGGWTSRPDLFRDTGSRFASLVKTPMQERIQLEGDMAVKLHPDTRIDAGGIGKGQGLEIINKTAGEMGIPAAFISFGGSSVLAIGSHPFGDTWLVGIPHPERDAEHLAEIPLRDSTLSVSGNSANNRRKFGDQGHILDPHTGAFFTREGLVTVVCPDPVEGEILSTALAAAGEDKGKEIVANFQGVTVQWLYPGETNDNKTN
jgi:thiamine biosynthesis lipoprotein